MLSLLFTANLLIGCGPTPQDVPSGVYSFEAVPEGAAVTVEDLAGVTLDIQIPDGLTVLSDAGEAEHALTLQDEEAWLRDCYTNSSYALSMRYAIEGGPLDLGATTIDTPHLSTFCGGRVLLWSSDGTVEDEPLAENTFSLSL
jgi:hypothetical protein